MTARKPLPVDLIDKKGLGGIYPANPLKSYGTGGETRTRKRLPSVDFEPPQFNLLRFISLYMLAFHFVLLVLLRLLLLEKVN